MTLPPAAATALAVAATGVATGVASSVAIHVWAATPLPTAWVAAASIAVVATCPRLPGWTAAPGLLALGLAEPIIQVISGFCSTESIANALPWVLPFAVGLAMAPARDALRRATGLHAWVGAVGLAASGALPRPAGIAILSALILMSTRVDAPLRKQRVAPTPAPWWGVFLAGGLGTVGLLAALVARTRTDPSLGALSTAGIGILAGLLVPRGRWSTLAALAGLVAAATTIDSSYVIRYPMAAVLVPLAAATIALRAFAPGRRLPVVGAASVGLAALLASNASLPQVTRLLSLDRSAAIGRNEAATPLAARSPSLAVASLAGPVAMWQLTGRNLVELDGLVVGGSRRQLDAERLAGILAGCATPGRARARAVGDELGEVATSLVEQGFSSVDIPAPDGRLPAALAQADTDLRGLWLRPELHLRKSPEPLSAWAGPRADAIVVVDRRPFTDARSLAIGDWYVQAMAAGLAPDGVLVAVVPSLGASAGTLSGNARVFADYFQVPSVWLPPSGWENAILVGSRAPIQADRLQTCVARSRQWLVARGLDSGVALAGLALAGKEWMAAQPPPGPEAESVAQYDEFALAALDVSAADATSAFDADLRERVAVRQATTRAAAAVFAASYHGNMEAALRLAGALSGQQGASPALEPLVRPILDQARETAAEAAKEGPDSVQWARVLSAIDGALLIHPASADAYCLRGDVHRAQSHPDVAVADYVKCTEFAPTNVAAWERLAHGRQATGDLSGYEAALRRAVSLAPSRASLSAELGLLLTNRESFDEAERWLRRSVDSADPKLPRETSLAHLGLANLELRKGAYELALAEAGLAEAIEPSSKSAYFAGAALHELSRADEAEAKFRLALTRDPRSNEARGGLGQCLAERGATEEAAEAFRAVLAADPTNVAARRNLELLAPALRAQPR